MWLALLISALAIPVGYDVGGPHQPVLDRFVALDRDGAAGATWVSQPSQWFTAWPDALSDGARGGTLRLDGAGEWVAVRVSPWALFNGRTAPGDWWIEVDGQVAWSAGVPATLDAFLASSHFAPVRRPVFRAGESAWERLIVHQHPWVRLQVPQGAFELAVVGRPLDAVIRAPSEAELREAIAWADARAREDYLRHTDTTASAPLPVGGHGVQVAGWGETPDPAAAAVGAAWAITAAPGELTGGVVWVHGDAQPLAVQLAAPAGVEVELTEPVWYDSRGRPAVTPRPLPAVLEPLVGGRVRGGQGLPAGLGLTIRLADDLPPGPLQLSLTLTGAEVHTVSITIDVLPFPLVEARPTGPFLGPDLIVTRWAEAGSPTQLAYLDASLDLLAARGLTAVGLQHSEWGLLSGSDDFPTEVLDHFEQAWAARGGRFVSWTDVKRDLRNDAMYDDDDVILSPARLTRAHQMIDAAAGSSMQWSIVLLEEEGWKSIEACRRASDYADLVRTITPPHVWLSGHVSHPACWQAVPALDTATWSGFPESTWENRRRVAGGDGLLVAYNHGGGRGGPLSAWHVDAYGLIEWQWSDEPSDPFAEIATTRTVPFGVLSPDGVPWSTPWLERLAIGVQDVRVLDTLESWVADPSCVGAEADAAREWLGLVHDALEAKRGHDDFDGDIWPEEVFGQVRAETVRHLRAVFGVCR